MSDPTSRIKGLTVQEIVTMWNTGTCICLQAVLLSLPCDEASFLLSELDDHVAAFRVQAEEVKKWDEQLRRNGQKVCSGAHILVCALFSSFLVICLCVCVRLPLSCEI